MITISEYKNVMSYFNGNKKLEELTKKEQKLAKKNINSYFKCQKEIDKLKKILQIQKEYEENENRTI